MLPRPGLSKRASEHGSRRLSGEEAGWVPSCLCDARSAGLEPGKCTADPGSWVCGRGLPRSGELEQTHQSPGLQDPSSALGSGTSPSQYHFSTHFCLRAKSCRGICVPLGCFVWWDFRTTKTWANLSGTDHQHKLQKYQRSEVLRPQPENF